MVNLTYLLLGFLLLVELTLIPDWHACLKCPGLPYLFQVLLYAGHPGCLFYFLDGACSSAVLVFCLCGSGSVGLLFQAVPLWPC